MLFYFLLVFFALFVAPNTSVWWFLSGGGGGQVLWTIRSSECSKARYVFLSSVGRGQSKNAFLRVCGDVRLLI